MVRVGLWLRVLKALGNVLCWWMPASMTVVDREVADAVVIYTGGRRMLVSAAGRRLEGR